MQVVIRTAHGSADVDIESYADDTTVRELLTAVTGLAVPTVADVDGRPCRTDDRLADVIAGIGLRVGSVIDITGDRAGAAPTGAPDPGIPVVALRQLSGRGTGAVISLPAGTFRFGAGRRVVDRELSCAVVEEEAFTLTVSAPAVDPEPLVDPGLRAAATGPPRPDTVLAPAVTVRPGARVAGELGAFTPTLDGRLFDRELEWTTGRLSVGGRVFDVIDPAPTTPSDDTNEVIGAARIGPPDRSGVRSFDAAGTVAALGDGERVPDEAVVGALARVADPARALWRRQPVGDRFAVPIGLSSDHEAVVSIDLDRHRGLAISGSTEFTAAMARTVLVELTTMLGPGDIDVVVVASAGRLGRWDWAKWIPQLRGGDPTRPPRFLTTDQAVAEWRAELADGDATDAPGGHLLRRAGWGPPGDPPPGSAASAASSALPPPSGRPHARPSADVAPRRTLVVVDDVAHWMRRDSPLRTLLIDAHANVRVVALAERVADAPGSCTAVVDEIRPDQFVDRSQPDDAAGAVAATGLFGSLCRLVERLGAAPVVTTDVRPALPEPHTAARIALDLASFDDLRVRRSNDPLPSATRSGRPPLGDLLALSMRPTGGADPNEIGGSDESDVVHVATRTTRPGPRTRVPIGRLVDPHPRASTFSTVDDNDAATIDVATARVTALAVDEPDRRQLVAALVLGVAARHDPSELAILMVGADEPGWLSPLPHLIGTVDGSDGEQVGRVLRRVADTLTNDPDFELLVVVDDAVATEGTPRLTDATLAFAELADALERVHLVTNVGTEHTDMLRRHLGDAAGAFLEARPDGSAVLAQRADDLAVGTVKVMPTVEVLLPIAQPPPPRAPTAGLRVKPFVFGRPLTPIERRLARNSTTLRPHDAVGAAVTSGSHAPASSGGGRGADLLPPPFPDRVAQETLRSDDDREAGLMPIGVVDRAADAGLDVLRWTPRSGSLIGVGHRRSGMGALVEVVAAGLVDIDAEVWVLDPLPQRRRAFRRLPRCRTTAEPESAAAVDRFLDEVERSVAQVRGRRDGSDGPFTPDHLADVVRGGPRPIVVVVADLNRTLAVFDDEGAARTIERLRSIATSSSASAAFDTAAVALVVSASRRAEVEPLIDVAGDVLVGDIDEQDRRAFGVPERPLRGGPRNDVAGRCWSVARQRLVQLATPPDRLERHVRERVESVTTAPAGFAAPSGRPVGHSARGGAAHGEAR